MLLDRKRLFAFASVLLAFFVVPQRPVFPEEGAPSQPAKETRRKARAKARPEGETARPLRGLGALVPDGVHFYASIRVTPERTKLLKPYFDAFQKLCASGIDKDLFQLATVDLSESRRERAAAIAGKVKSLLTTPRWGELVRREVAVAYRFSFPVPEYLFLFRVAEGSAGERRAELRRMLEGFAEFAPQTLQVRDASKRGAEISTLEVSGIPVGIHVASRGGVLAISTSEMFLDRVLEIAETRGFSDSFVRGEAYRAAFAGLEGPAETRAYFDFPGYVKFLRNMLDLAPPGASDSPHGRAVLEISRIVLDELSRIGPFASADRTAEDRIVTDMRIPFARDSDPGFIESLIRDQKPFDDVLRVVPADAKGFYFSAGMNPLRIYDALVDLVREHVPNGEEILGRWSELQDRIAFHVRDDLLSWLDGGFGCLCLPGEGRSKEWLAFFRVRDADRARSFLEAAYGRIQRFLEKRGQTIEAVPLSDPVDTLYELRVSALPWLRPIVGTAGDVLVIASSRNPVERVARTFRGEAPSFRDTEAASRLGLPEGPVGELYYGDLKHSLRGIANLVSGAGFVTSILPDMNERKPLRKLGAVLTKLGAFIREIDLAGEYGGWSRYDPEARAIISRTFQQVRPSSE